MIDLPVVVVGAGPQGLAAAAHLLERGENPLVLEAGDAAAAAVRQWAHVRLFSSWSELVDPASARLLAAGGWVAPAEGYPTGGEWVDGYLAPLAAALGDRVRYGSRVTGVSRRGRDRLVSAGRGEQPFTVHGVANGQEFRLDARAVIDASGTWGQPGPAGADGLPAIGERAAAETGVLTYLPPTPAAMARVRWWTCGGGRQWAFRDDCGDRPGRAGRVSSGHPGQLGAASRSGRRHVRRWRSGSASPTGRVGRARPGSGRQRVSRPGHRFPGRADRADRGWGGAGGRGRSPAGGRRPGGGADRFPARSVVPVRGAAGSGPGAAGAGAAGRRNRPQRAFLRQREPPRRRGADPARARPVPGGDEVLRPGADVPGPDRVRAGAERGGRADR